MGLHDELSTEAGSCIVCAYITRLAPSEQAEWRRELALPVRQVGNTAVVKALARRGVSVSETSVRRHRARHGL